MRLTWLMGGVQWYRMSCPLLYLKIVIGDSGVLQGSHTGPLLFNVFINSAVNVIKFSNVYTFADDIKLSMKINKPSDASKLNTDLMALYNWSLSNKLSINLKKTVLMRFSRARCVFEFDYRVNNVSIVAVLEHNLGVWCDHSLSLILQVNSVKK